MTAVSRLPRDEDGMPRYFHPHGYVIVKERRTWSERVGAIRGASFASPLSWWSIYEHASSGPSHRFHPWAHKPRRSTDAGTLREAREWCDEHPRAGWAAAR